MPISKLITFQPS